MEVEFGSEKCGLKAGCGSHLSGLLPGRLCTHALCDSAEHDGTRRPRLIHGRHGVLREQISLQGHHDRSAGRNHLVEEGLRFALCRDASRVERLLSSPGRRSKNTLSRSWKGRP